MGFTLEAKTMLVGFYLLSPKENTPEICFIWNFRSCGFFPCCPAFPCATRFSTDCASPTCSGVLDQQSSTCTCPPMPSLQERRLKPRLFSSPVSAWPASAPEWSLLSWDTTLLSMRWVFCYGTALGKTFVADWEWRLLVGWGHQVLLFFWGGGGGGCYVLSFLPAKWTFVEKECMCCRWHRCCVP